MVFTKDHGLISRSIFRHANSPTYTNRRMVPVSGETEKESSNIDTVHFISANEVEDGPDDTLPDISYKDAIDTIQHIHDIMDHNILIRGKFY